MLTEQVSNISRYGTRRLLSLLAAASVCFILVTYWSIPKPHKDAILATVTGKASQLGHQAPIPAHQQPATAAVPPPPPPPTKKHASVWEAASNRTLGLDSLVFLNLPHRHDRYDAMAIQAHISDIKITRFAAVDAKELRDVGMPPTEKPTRLNLGEKGCWRAHANVWQHMLENQIPALLVLESDAGWDVNIRSIMGRLNGGFRELLKKDNPDTVFEEDPDDPWLARSGAWDMLSIGHCVDSRAEDGSHVVYDDPDAPNLGVTMKGIDTPLVHKRAVYRAHSIVCTTGYLVSLQGAARLLVRTTWNLEEPVDLIIAMMTASGELKTYSQQQVIVAQWAYIPGIGKDGDNSDIHGSEDKKDATTEGWERAKKNRASVEINEMYLYKEARFRDFALGRAWYHTIGDK